MTYWRPGLLKSVSRQDTLTEVLAELEAALVSQELERIETLVAGLGGSLDALANSDLRRRRILGPLFREAALDADQGRLEDLILLQPKARRAQLEERRQELDAALRRSSEAAARLRRLARLGLDLNQSLLAGLFPQEPGVLTYAADGRTQQGVGRASLSRQL